MNQEKIGKFIAKCRKEKNITQEQLADKLNVTSKSISRWENGKTMPDYSLIKLLCDEFSISINEFFSGEKIKSNNYELKANENLNCVLKEYYKMKKQKKIIKNALIIVLILFISFILKVLLLLGVVSLTFLVPAKNITGIENYNKSYYIKEYGGDLNSNLSIFPDNKSNLLNATFSSSFQTNLFDSDGYILLTSKYSKNDFDDEIDRLSKINIVITESCYDNSDSYINYIKYDEKSYSYPAFIAIDGFGHTYEYALINKENLEIIYVYLSYPSEYNSIYKKYLKNDKSIYSKINTLNLFSIYNHSFDGGDSFIEYNDC